MHTTPCATEGLHRVNERTAGSSLHAIDDADLIESLATALAEARNDMRTWGDDSVPDAYWDEKEREVIERVRGTQPATFVASPGSTMGHRVDVPFRPTAGDPWGPR